jgi:hypothetical protein
MYVDQMYVAVRVETPEENLGGGGNLRQMVKHGGGSVVV